MLSAEQDTHFTWKKIFIDLSEKQSIISSRNKNMANNRITKETFANSLKELLRERPLTKISVKDITSRCDISRNAFYYHFRDKYELINWMFYDDMLKNANSFNSPSELTHSFADVCRCLYNNREFYMACFQYVGQNSLYETLHNLYYELWKMNLEMRYMESRIRLSEEELDLMAKLNSYALVGIITDWVKNGMHNNYLRYFEKVRRLLDMEYLTIPDAGNMPKSEEKKAV